MPTPPKSLTHNDTFLQKNPPNRALLHIATYLPLEELESSSQAIPGIAKLFSINHLLTPLEDDGNTIVHIHAQNYPYPLATQLFLEELIANSRNANLHPKKKKNGVIPLLYASGGEYED
ncbi:hypothetical protein BDV06DRAFT_27254 [Aspergillus oleicola]